ncbi:hypothetical protein LPU83_pLPU83d_1692 (plasmid) [Rhizobium favelukesii]|uniref:Uncharacterized protein n=1 Tax=Rhizobium favelukesii TaxID=348824 RepID=W6RPU1_9HYPH|nr:hypothetical protein LPU83_pLPU83d_1692 [Rhizobium favelukesii]
MGIASLHRSQICNRPHVEVALQLINRKVDDRRVNHCGIKGDIHKDVDPAESFHDLSNGVRDLIAIAEVAFYPERTTTQGLNMIDDRGDVRRSNRPDSDFRSFSGE